MRTTIDLPDALARRAKIHAVETDSTLRNLIVTALEKELASSEASQAHAALDSGKIPKLPATGRKPYSLSYDEIDRHLREDLAP
jgi:hypothetical protein